MPGPGRGPGGGNKNNEKPLDMGKTLRTLMHWLAPYKFTFIAALVLAALSVALSVYGPKVIGQIITEIATGFMNKITGKGGIDFDRIAHISLMLLALFGASAVFEYVQGWMMAGVSTKMGYSLRKAMAEKIDRLPLSYFDTHSHGDVLSRFTNDVDTLVQSLNQSMSSLVSNAVKVVGFLIMMLSISWKMTLLAFIVIPLSLLAVGVVVTRSQKYYQAQQNNLGNLNGHIEEMYTDHVIVQSFNGEQKSIAQFTDLNDKLYHSAWRSQFLSGVMQPLTTFIGNLGYVSVCILGGILAVNGEIAIGEIQSCITYTRNFTQPINQIANSMNMLQSAAAGAERVFKFLDEAEMPAEPAKPVVLEPEDVHGKVEFDHIKFGYIPGKTIIHDFSLNAAPGQSVAIVGPTGAGKTTLIKLLMRFYDLDSGKITLDGIDLTNMTRKNVRDCMGMVLQDTWLFEGTVKENLKFGKPDATDEEVIAAAKAAHAHHFIEGLENGYDTVLQEDSDSISQGQKQLLTIARAFLANPKILILDEATSSVDTRTEKLIQNAMDELMKGRTSFVIAHRLSTVRNAESILVLQDGDIAEIGNHEELMKKNGLYAELYNAQFSGQEI